MDTEQTNCNLGSLLSCRGHEDFARRLSCKLTSLGSSTHLQNEDEANWLERNGDSGGGGSGLTLCQQPKLSETNGIYYLESPASPQELTENGFDSLINHNEQNGVDNKNQNEESSHLEEKENDLKILSSIDLSDLVCNGQAQNEETYTTHLTISNDLTVECPKVLVSQASLVQQNSFHDNDEEEEERTPRVRRCSSLKTGKTPPGTPSRKKIVRFADVLGLDLADIRTFLDEIPKVPTSAYDDLKNVDLNSECDTPFNAILGNLSHGIKVDRIVVPLFQQPGGLPNFLEQIREQNVCLENAIVDDPFALAIAGTVRVRNLDFHKSVHIRYTLDNWQTFADLQATYVENSCDGFSDTFKFLIYAHSLTIGYKLQFAVRYQCKGVQYWDNNKGVNYCFECLPATNSTSAAISAPLVGEENWGASFY